jgi:hypothetical protein
MTPKCCQRCPCLTEDGDCPSFGKRCARWSHWFHREWTKIRIAAAKLKEKRKQALVEESPVEEAPVEEAPVEETPVEEIPPTIQRRPSVCLPRDYTKGE